MSIVGGLFGLALVAGCAKSDIGPRFAGKVVSYVDTYGSGTGTQSVLGREGSMKSGFDYGDASKVDWTSEVTWRFLRRDDTNDVHRVEWTFLLKGGLSDTKAKEVSFDGTQAVRVFDNQWQVISIEPGSITRNSQPDGAASASQPIRAETNSTSSGAGSRR
ncbi:MAG: hypothetical protein AB9869_33295 [Verrucomicrobiia bacterium]